MSNNTSSTENIIEILSKLQEFLRRPIIKNKLNDFYNLNEDEQKEIIVRVLDSINNIDERDVRNLAKTWIEELSKMENIKINCIFKLYLEEVMKKPHLIKKINSIALDSIRILDKGNKIKLIDCFKEVLFFFHNKGYIIKEISTDSKKLLKIKE